MAANKPNLSKYALWKKAELQRHMRERGLPTTMGVEELRALAYAMDVLKIQPVPSKEDEKKSRSECYRKLLCIDGKELPDPLELKYGWVGETNGMSQWPPTMITDISTYLKVNNEVDLEHRLMGEYKEGKAYSYFSSNFVRETLYHGISDDSPYCFMKTESGRSQRRNDEDHQVWICINKKRGTVLSAYCSCFAGLSSTCNHVVAVLFKMDFAWQQGFTNKSVTDMPSQWTQPKGKTTGPDVMEIGDLEWVKPRYGKKKNSTTSSSQRLKSQNLQSPSLQELMAALYASNRDSCVLQYAAPECIASYCPEDDVNVEMSVYVKTTLNVPQSMSVLFAQDAPLVFDDVEVEAIAQATHGQHSNPQWYSQRVGRVTGSISHAVLVYARKKKTGKQFSTEFVESIMGRKQTPDVPAIKYGRIKEPIAREDYAHIMRPTGHKSIEVKTTGLHVLKSHIFLVASPDAIVQCGCCSPGILEIKSPISPASSTPHENPPAYLTKNAEGQFFLKKTHHCFTQVQVQLLVTGANWCDFFIYTPNGHHLERIVSDAVMQKEIIEAAQLAFDCVIRPQLVQLVPTPSHQPQVPVTATSGTSDPQPAASTADLAIATLSKPDSPPKGRNKPAAKKTRRRKTRKTGKPVYLCGVCQKLCKDSGDITENDDNSVGCDQCYKWYHWGCVGFDVCCIDNDWFCSNCSDC